MNFADRMQEAVARCGNAALVGLDPYLNDGAAIGVIFQAKNTPLLTQDLTRQRRAALLHGEWVKPGDKFGEAVVEKIDDQSVTLHHPDGRRETIRMYPEVDVQSSRAVKRMAGR